TYNPALEINESHPIYQRLVCSRIPARDLLLRSIQNWFGQRYPSTFMHDPLTLSWVIDESFVRFEVKSLEMDPLGIMRLSDHGTPTSVSVQADYQGFMEVFSERLPF